MSSCTLDTVTSTNGKTMKRNTTRFRDQDDTWFGHDEVPAQPVRCCTFDQRAVTERVATTLLDSTYIGTMISLFGAIHPSLTSRAFWTSQILLELDYILWRPEFLGREPSDVEMEWLAEKCMEMMWPQITQRVKKEREGSAKRRGEVKDGSGKGKHGHECSMVRRRRCRETARTKRETRVLEEALEGMGIGDEEEVQNEVQSCDEEKMQNEVPWCDEVRIRASLAEGRGVAPTRNKHKRHFSGHGVTCVLESTYRADESDVRRGAQVNGRIRPGNAGCLLKKSLCLEEASEVKRPTA